MALETGIGTLKAALEGDDIDAISSASAALSQAMMKMGEAAYQAEAPDADNAEAAPDDETVVDADFEEVDGTAGDNERK